MEGSTGPKAAQQGHAPGLFDDAEIPTEDRWLGAGEGER